MIMSRRRTQMVKQKADKDGDMKADKFYGDLEAVRNAEMKAVEMVTRRLAV
jgi:hypothetical protein